jgi:hypothetical protein
MGATLDAVGAGIATSRGINMDTVGGTLLAGLRCLLVGLPAALRLGSHADGLTGR